MVHRLTRHTHAHTLTNTYTPEVCFYKSSVCILIHSSPSAALDALSLALSLSLSHIHTHTHTHTHTHAHTYTLTQTPKYIPSLTRIHSLPLSFFPYPSLSFRHTHTHTHTHTLLPESSNVFPSSLKELNLHLHW